MSHSRNTCRAARDSHAETTDAGVISDRAADAGAGLSALRRNVAENSRRRWLLVR